MKEVYKLQRPLFATEADAPALAYTQRRSRDIMVPMTPELAALFGDKVKIYAECEVRAGKLVVGKVVADKAW